MQCLTIYIFKSKKGKLHNGTIGRRENRKKWKTREISGGECDGWNVMSVWFYFAHSFDPKNFPSPRLHIHYHPHHYPFSAILFFITIPRTSQSSFPRIHQGKHYFHNFLVTFLMDFIILLHGFLIFQECICNDVFFFSNVIKRITLQSLNSIKKTRIRDYNVSLTCPVTNRLISYNIIIFM